MTIAFFFSFISSWAFLLSSSCLEAVYSEYSCLPSEGSRITSVLSTKERSSYKPFAYSSVGEMAKTRPPLLSEIALTKAERGK